MSAVIQFPTHIATHTPHQKEARVVANCDDGFTRLANDLLDALIEADLTKHQYKVALAVTRKTYGYGKKLDWVSGAQLADATGMTENKCRDAIRSLVARKILVREGRKIGWNTVISEWKNKQPQNGVNDPETGLKNNPKTGLRTTPKRGHTKDNIQKKERKEIKPSSSKNADALPDAVVTESVSLAITPPRPESAVHTPNGKFWGTADDLTCAEYIHSKVLVVNPTAKTPNWAQWANDIRLMREQDGRTHHEICSLFKWANLDPFWSANVLCPKTLRKQWDKLTTKRTMEPVAMAARGQHTDLTQSMTAAELNRLMQEGF